MKRLGGGNHKLGAPKFAGGPGYISLTYKPNSNKTLGKFG